MGKIHMAKSCQPLTQFHGWLDLVVSCLSQTTQDHQNHATDAPIYKENTYINKICDFTSIPGCWTRSETNAKNPQRKRCKPEEINVSLMRICQICVRFFSDFLRPAAYNIAANEGRVSLVYCPWSCAVKGDPNK